MVVYRLLKAIRLIWNYLGRVTTDRGGKKKTKGCELHLRALQNAKIGKRTQLRKLRSKIMLLPFWHIRI